MLHVNENGKKGKKKKKKEISWFFEQHFGSESDLYFLSEMSFDFFYYHGQWPHVNENEKIK